VSEEKLRKAEERGRMQALMDLVDVVDDCDRAMELIYSADQRRTIAEGIEQMRKRLLRRFESAGLRSYGKVGEEFDPHRHEAIGAEPGYGPDNSIIKVHQRGWTDGRGKVVRPALVTVCRGTPEGPPPVRPQADGARPYICPYGSPGCSGDCPSCQMAFGAKESSS